MNTPASSTDTGVEAWVWASGSQLCSGTSGIMCRADQQGSQQPELTAHGRRLGEHGVRLKSTVPVSSAKPKESPQDQHP